MYRFALFVLLALFYQYAYSAEIATEKYNSGWRVNTDNDLFAAQHTDRDYTGGLAFTLSGKRVQTYPLTIDSWRTDIDRLIHFSALYKFPDILSFHSQQYGMTLFTPDDIDSTAPVYNDRPYASLFFMSNTEFTVAPKHNTAYLSILTIGLLGMDFAKTVQRSLHGLTNSTVPRGWQYQVSSGGEPTLMFTYGVQNNIFSSRYQQLKLEYEANLGFITDVNLGFSWRWGRLNSPWWMFNPYQSKYIQQSMPVFSGRTIKNKPAFYLYAGARLNLRVYNALLQGQFRHSEVRINYKDLKHLVAEYWLGLTGEFARTWSVSIFLRGNTDEFKGPNARSVLWGGLVLSRAY